MAAQQDPQFTVFIRLPFPREDFVDPPQAEWNPSKEEVLWEVLSQPSNDIDWKSLAENLDVTLPFLLQQAAWLYDRKLAQVRAQLRKAGNQQSAPGSPIPSSTSGAIPFGGQPMNRAGSSGSAVPTRLSIAQREDFPRLEGSVPATPIKSKVVQAVEQKSTHEALSPRWQSQQRPPTRPTTGRGGSLSRREHKTSSSRLISSHGEAHGEGDLESRSSFSSSTTSDSQSGDNGRPGLPFRRFGKFSVPRLGRRNLEEEEEDDDSPAFLPLSPNREELNEPDLRDTLRQQPGRRDLQSEASDEPTSLPTHPGATETSTSSVSSGMEGSYPAASGSQPARRPGPLSPRRTAELARLNSRQRRPRSGSEGTPSMGSSFSDLDDASVTQSALEEALLSNMQHGTIASRMSTISQAFKSRYL